MSPADAALIGRWRDRRDPDAFTEIVSRYSGLVYATCRRVLKNACEAEDVTQECFMELMRGHRRVRSSLGSWLHTMAVHRSLDRIKTEKRRRLREERFADAQHTHADPEVDDVLARVDEAIDQLPEELKVAIVHRFLEGKTHQEIAQTLNIGESTVRFRLNKGLERLRASLTRRGITVAGSALSALLGAQLAEAAPARVIASLGKQAIAQASAVSAGAVGAGFMAKAVVGVAVLLAAAVLVTQSLRSSDDLANQDPSQAAVSAGPDNLLAVSNGGGLESQDAVGLRSLRADNGVLHPPSPAPGAGDQAQALKVAAAKPGETRAEVTISGYVIGPEGDAVPGAIVTVVPGSPATSLGGTPSITVWPFQFDSDRRGVLSAKTDTSGNYTLAGVAPPTSGSVVASVSAAGYRHATRIVDVSSGEPVENANFILKEGETLRARLVDPHGVPVAHAVVQRFGSRWHTEQGYGNGGHDHITTTDEAGLFTMGFWRQGVVILKTFSDRAGKDVFMDIPIGLDEVVTLRMRQPAMLSGHVVNAGGAPLPGATVHVEGKFSQNGVAERHSVTTAQDGAYQVPPLAPGLNYVLTVTSAAGNTLCQDRHIGTLAPGEDKVYELVLGPVTKVTGLVTGARSGRAHPGTRIRYWMDGQALEDIDGTGTDPLAGQETHTDEQGRYELLISARGPCVVFPENNEMKRADAIDLYGQQLVAGDSREHQINFVLPDKFGLRVKAVDAQGVPIDDAAVEVLRALRGVHKSTFSSGRTNAEGQYKYDMIEAGAECWFEVAKDGYAEVASTRIVGEPGVTYPEETVVLYEAAGVEGIAVDDQGLPLANRTFRLFAESTVGNATTPAIRAHTDEEGSFVVLTGIPGTDVVLRFNAEEEDWLYTEAGPFSCRPGHVSNVGTVAFCDPPEEQSE